MPIFAKLTGATLSLIAVLLLNTRAIDSAQAADPAAEQTTKQAAPAAPQVAVDAKQIEHWVADLDNDDFQTRENATSQLIKAGAPAVPAIEKATLSKSFEQSSRAMRILDQMSRSKADADMLAANAALARLSKSDNESVAQQAQQAIESAKPKTPKQDPNNRIIQLPGGGKIQVQIQGGGIIQGIQGAPGAVVQATSISKTSVNGVETTEVSEASGRKIKIEKNKTIKVTVTEKVKGKDETKTYEADDEEALKKKHADAYKLYEKYGKGNGVPNLRAFGIQRGNIFPVPANRAQALPNRRAMQKSAAEAQAKLEKIIEQLDASKKAGDKADLDALRSQVEEAIKDLKEAQGSK